MGRREVVGRFGDAYRTLALLGIYYPGATQTKYFLTTHTARRASKSQGNTSDVQFQRLLYLMPPLPPPSPIAGVLEI